MSISQSQQEEYDGNTIKWYKKENAWAFLAQWVRQKDSKARSWFSLALKEEISFSLSKTCPGYYFAIQNYF